MEHEITFSTARRPTWRDMAYRFIDTKECLASYLALESAEVLHGEKPANLVSIPNRRRSCGRNLYELWHEHGTEVVSASGLAARELADRGDSVLLLLYSPRLIEELLKRPSVTTVLKKAGYTGFSSVGQILDEISARISASEFPHEIGVFLGYPLKDVAAFMGLASIPFSCQGPWKIFGDPRPSLRLAERFRCCRIAMAQRLAAGTSPFICLDGMNLPAGAFSGADIENDSQFLRPACA